MSGRAPRASGWTVVRLQDNPYFAQPDREAQANLVVFRGASDGFVHPFKFLGYGGAWMEPINDALSAVLLGEQDADTALAEAQRRLDLLTGR